MRMNMRHNLGGWLRDVRSALDDSSEQAYTMLAQLHDLMTEVMGLYEGMYDDREMEDADGIDELADEELNDGDDEVAVQQPRGRSIAGPERKLVGPSKSRVVERPAAVAGDVPRDLQEVRGGSRRRAAAVAAAGRGRVSRGTRSTKKK